MPAGRAQALSQFDLVRAELRGPATLPAAGTGSSQPVTGVSHDQFTLELGQDRQHAEHRAALGSGRIDPLLEHFQTDAALA